VDDLQSEKEQIEEIKAWWAEYGRYIIAGIVIAVGLLIGFNQYSASKIKAQTEASALFETLAGHVADGELEEAVAVSSELSSNYANTAYAAQSKLAMARLYMDKNRDQDAVETLKELLAMRDNAALRHVGRLRLARIYLYQDKPQDVIDLLEGQDNDAFAGLYAEANGDAYAALGDYNKAEEEYELALADTTQSVNRAFVQMKLLDLPAEAPASEPVAEPAEEAMPEAAAQPDEAAEEVAVEEEGGESE
jgi:predicted negative regulator of RcsB-dependent stress response